MKLTIDGQEFDSKKNDITIVFENDEVDIFGGVYMHISTVDGTNDTLFLGSPRNRSILIDRAIQCTHPKVTVIEQHHQGGITTKCDLCGTEQSYGFSG